VDAMSTVVVSAPALSDVTGTTTNTLVLASTTACYNAGTTTASGIGIAGAYVGSWWYS
jgi:hypothetical protein